MLTERRETVPTPEAELRTSSGKTGMLTARSYGTCIYTVQCELCRDTSIKFVFFEKIKLQLEARTQFAQDAVPAKVWSHCPSYLKEKVCPKHLTGIVII